MLTEESIVTAHDTRFTIFRAPTTLPCINFATFGIRQLAKVRVDAVNLVAVNAACPNEATVAQIEALLALHGAGDAQGAFIFRSSIPAVVGHQVDARRSRINSRTRTPK